MRASAIVSIQNLMEEPYASIVCYPRTNPTEIQKRIEELKQHGVSAVEFVWENLMHPTFLFLAKAMSAL